MASARARGFTLVELLVVIAIIGTLTSMVLPATQSAREAGRQVTCANHLRQIALAMRQYEDREGHLPPARIHPSIGGDHESAFLMLLPYIEQDNLYDRYEFEDENGESLKLMGSERNLEVARTSIPLYLCPSMALPPADPERLAPGSYAVNTGSRYPWAAAWHNGPIVAPPQELNLTNIQDSEGTTIAFGEFDYFQGTSTSGPQWAGGYIIHSFGSTWGTFNPLHKPGPGEDGLYGRRYTAFRSDHPGGANFAMVSSTVRFLNESIDSTVLDALATRSGEESVSLP